MTTTLNAGTYYLQVGRYSGGSFGSFNNTHTYELQASFIPPGGDPLVLDLGAPGIALTSLAAGVAFDINGDGVKDQVAWTAGDDGFLAFDANHNGVIDNGSELFSP